MEKIMQKLKFTLPNFNYTDYEWIYEDSVTILDRSNEFESQNLKFIEAGYNKDNTTYYRAFEVDKSVHDFCKTVFPKYSVGIMKQPPGQTLPLHEDTYYKFATVNNIDPYSCCRVNIFLEDWKPGHYLEINQTPITKWSKGDAILINREEFHLSGNMGMEDKYTMQITGVKDAYLART